MTEPIFFKERCNWHVNLLNPTLIVSLVLKICLVYLAAEKPGFIQPLKDVNAAIESTITLTAKVKGFPTPNLVWRINDAPIEESEMVTIEVQKPVTHVLTLKSVAESLSGAVVSLTAANVAGEAVSQSKLTISGRAPQFIATPIKCTVLEGTESILIILVFSIVYL